MRMHERKSIRRMNDEVAKTVDLVMIGGSQRKKVTKAKSKEVAKNDAPGKIGETGSNPSSSQQRLGPSYLTFARSNRSS
jgi:hypothetical protein